MTRPKSKIESLWGVLRDELRVKSHAGNGLNYTKRQIARAIRREAKKSTLDDVIENDLL